MKMKAVNILWDMDEEDVMDGVVLPDVVYIPESLTNVEDIDDIDDEAISDYLSDEFGFCHGGFYLVEVTEAEDTLVVYDGEKVFLADEFSFDKVFVGDYVDEEVVRHFMDVLPPACMRSDCSQLGEPYSHRQDPDTGEWKSTYQTFKRVYEYAEHKAVWQYCGKCFRGENVERGKDPVYC